MYAYVCADRMFELLTTTVDRHHNHSQLYQLHHRHYVLPLNIHIES